MKRTCMMKRKLMKRKLMKRNFAFFQLEPLFFCVCAPPYTEATPTKAAPDVTSQSTVPLQSTDVSCPNAFVKLHDSGAASGKKDINGHEEPAAANPSSAPRKGRSDSAPAECTGSTTAVGPWRGFMPFRV